MTKLGIILSSARPNRVGEPVSRWVRDHVPADVEIDLIDLRDVALPAFDGETSPKQGLPKTSAHSVSWSERIAALDALVKIGRASWRKECRSRWERDGEKERSH